MVIIVYKATLLLVREKLKQKYFKNCVIVNGMTVRYLLDWIVSLLLFPRVTGNIRIPLECCQVIPSFRLSDNYVYFHE